MLMSTSTSVMILKIELYLGIIMKFWPLKKTEIFSQKKKKMWLLDLSCFICKITENWVSIKSFFGYYFLNFWLYVFKLK